MTPKLTLTNDSCLLPSFLTSKRFLLMSETVIREVGTFFNFLWELSHPCPQVTKGVWTFSRFAETQSVISILLFALQTVCSVWHLAHWREIHGYSTSEWRSMGPRFDATECWDENEDRWAWTRKVRDYGVYRMFTWSLSFRYIIGADAVHHLFLGKPVLSKEMHRKLCLSAVDPELVGDYRKAYPSAKLIAPEAALSRHDDKTLTLDGGKFAVSFNTSLSPYFIMLSLGPRSSEHTIRIWGRCAWLRGRSSWLSLILAMYRALLLQIDHW